MKQGSRDYRLSKPEGGGPLGRVVYGEVGLSGGERGGGEAEGAAEEAGAGALGGEDVDVGVADHDGVVAAGWASR